MNLPSKRAKKRPAKKKAKKKKKANPQRRGDIQRIVKLLKGTEELAEVLDDYGLNHGDIYSCDFKAGVREIRATMSRLLGEGWESIGR
jgi:hypothetical protein